MKDMEDNIIVVKSMEFAIAGVKIYQFLEQRKGESVLSRQLLRSGTGIGANVKEAIRAQSRADFHAKMCIALKEASESEYWIALYDELPVYDSSYTLLKRYMSFYKK